MRKEVKVKGPMARAMDFEDLLALLERGAPEFEMAQNLKDLTHRLNLVLAAVQTCGNLMSKMVEDFVGIDRSILQSVIRPKYTQLKMV